ncbi:LysR family transcriptional regulator [Leisingera sp. ANG59]|uniref:LysR family transcriptional regulator n=1 Tax=Leisingera sp. ANG59 TaxID=2675221 RepID=UPI001571F9AD|nr:LysR family transcriptional regulator [Leisingera sp. ANG59]
MNWNNLKVFCAVARKKNLTDAATELRISASTASRKISELEDSLGGALFNRRTTGYYLTLLGERILPIAMDTEAQMGFIMRQASSGDTDKRCVVRIDLPELLGTHIILPALSCFQKDNPHIAFEFLNSVQNIKLSGHASDIVIRLSAPTSGQYKVRRAGQITQAAYCSPKFFDRHRTALEQREYDTIPFIGWCDDFRHIPLARWLDEATRGAELWMQMSSLQSQLAAISEGLGIGVVPKFAAARHDLVHVLRDCPPLNSGLWLMRNSETEGHLHVDAVMECIEAALHDNQSSLVCSQAA